MSKTCFLWDPIEDNIVEELDTLGAVSAQYTTEPSLYGNVISQARSILRSHHHFDGAGSTIACTDGSQDTTDVRATTAFGELTESIGATPISFLFLGQAGYYHDNVLSCYLVRRRVYMPSLSRWQSLDPLDSADTGQSSFVYVANAPLRYQDPSGLVVRDFSPLSVNNAPWCKVGKNKPDSDYRTGPVPADPNGLAPNVRADTKVIKYDIHCACQCVNATLDSYSLSCIVWAYFQIRIAPTHIYGKNTMEGSYGHEQHHLKHFLDTASFAADFASEFETVKQTTLVTCRSWATYVENIIRKHLRRRHDIEETHAHGDKDFRPQANTDYPGAFDFSMPRKPNCKLPGTPTKDVAELPCC